MVTFKWKSSRISFVLLNVSHVSFQSTLIHMPETSFQKAILSTKSKLSRGDAKPVYRYRYRVLTSSFKHCNYRCYAFCKTRVMTVPNLNTWSSVPSHTLCYINTTCLMGKQMHHGYYNNNNVHISSSVDTRVQQ